MKRKILIFTVLFVSLSLTSCIDIIEEITVNNDKSGHASIRIDAGTIGFLMSSAADYISQDMLSEIIEAPNNKVAKLKKINGISDAKAINLLKSGKLGLKFKFKNQKALNKAYYSLFGMEKKWYYPAIFKIKKHKFKKKNTASYFQKYLQENKENLQSEDVLKMIDYKCIYHFPDIVSDIKNETGTKLISNKTVVQSYNAHTLLNEEVDMGNVIYF